MKIMKQKPVLEMLPKPFSTFVRLFDFHCSHKLHVPLKFRVKQNHCSMESCDGSFNLIDKWLYKNVSRNDLPIKDHNFTFLE